MGSEVFRLLKFKTMIDLTGEDGKPLPDKDRLSRFGIILRGSSLDELPQLFNVFSGEMSIVGPRPLLTDYLPLYNSFQRRRHEIRPGVTGWAQVNGRNSISWEDKFKMDVWYVDNATFFLDLKIIIMTVVKAIKREGINSQNATTMTPFKGN